MQRCTATAVCVLAGMGGLWCERNRLARSVAVRTAELLAGADFGVPHGFTTCTARLCRLPLLTPAVLPLIAVPTVVLYRFATFLPFSAFPPVGLTLILPDAVLRSVGLFFIVGCCLGAELPTFTGGCNVLVERVESAGECRLFYPLPVRSAVDSTFWSCRLPFNRGCALRYV